MIAEDFALAARSFVGAKWRHRGRSERAMDCLGLLFLSAVRVGQDWQDVKGYGREPWDNQLATELERRFGAPVPRDKIQVGDILLIRWRESEPSHVGVAGLHPDGGLTIVHVHTLLGCVEQSLRGPILSVVVAAYRPWGDE